MSAPGPEGPAERPNRWPWPPLIFGGAFLVGIGLKGLVPLGWPVPAAAGQSAGWVLLFAGLALDIWAMASLHRARTTILPHRPAGRLVTDGPFAFTRNPIYLGNTLALLGLGLMLENPWLLAAAVIAAIATDHLAARREEAHLAARFGAEFAAYAQQVPRWVGRARPLTPPPADGPDCS